MSLLWQKCSNFSFAISLTPINRYYLFICLTLVLNKSILFIPTKELQAQYNIQTYNLLPIPIVFSQCFVEVKDFSEYRFALSEFVLQTDGQVELFICCQ